MSEPPAALKVPQAYDARRQSMLADAPVAPILVAADIERAKRFYGEKLGLRLIELPSVPEDGALFGCGEGTMLYLYKREGGTKAEHTVVGWRVDDVEKAVAELRQKGVVFEQYEMPGLKTDERGIAESDGVRSAWFKDTEGNILAISEY
jgi:catechol 2,3-dioxygenase-like lactoylglutathione lyase family enzyme